MIKKIRALLLFLLLIGLVFFWGISFYPHTASVPSGGSLEVPSKTHWLGTDDLGIDIFAQVSNGFFLSLSIGLAAAGLAFILGGALGILAGYAGGRTDALISFLINVFLSVPQLPVMIVLGAFLGQSIYHVILIIGFFSWAGIAKIMRSKTRSVRGKPYIQLARSFGGGFAYILRRHMLADLLPLLWITGLAIIGHAILLESSLAYLGLSNPLSRSWGLMISKAIAFSGIYFTDYWQWWLLPPVVSLIFTVLCLRLLVRQLEMLWVSQ